MGGLDSGAGAVAGAGGGVCSRVFGEIVAVVGDGATAALLAGPAVAVAGTPFGFDDESGFDGEGGVDDDGAVDGGDGGPCAIVVAAPADGFGGSDARMDGAGGGEAAAPVVFTTGAVAAVACAAGVVDAGVVTGACPVTGDVADVDGDTDAGGVTVPVPDVPAIGNGWAVAGRTGVAAVFGGGAMPGACTGLVA